MKLVIVLLMFLQVLVANIDLNSVPLRAKVVGVASWDVLNIRQSPNWRSKKVGFVKNGEENIGIYKCKKLGKSVWCKIFYSGQIGQYGDDGFNEDSKPGWVNAKYLSGYSRGYVVLDNKPNCDYALECRNNRCKIVADYKMGSNHNITSLKTRWVSRSRLKATNSGDIGGGEDASGMCEMHIFVEHYLATHKTANSAFSEAKRVINALRAYDYRTLAKLIHPRYGLKIAISEHFDSFAHTFNKAVVKNPSNRKLFWGYTQGRGDKIYKSLRAILRDLKLPKVSKIDKNTSLKGFKCSGTCKAYLFKYTPKSIYKYKGVLVIMKKYNNKWYLVALLKSGWSI